MKLAIYIIALSLFTDCGNGYELVELYSQQIENSDKIIFEYQAWSTLNDGSKYGKTILDKNESISIREVKQMPFEFLVGHPKYDTLLLIGLKEGSTQNPKYVSTQLSNFKGLTIMTDYYSYEIGSYTNITYKFLTFRETKDSLIIIGLEKDHFNIPTNKSEIGFLKGNIKLVESDSSKGIVKQIEIRAILSRAYNKTSIDKVTIIRNDSLQIDGLVNFTFEPSRLISTSEFSNFGIYKKREIKDVKTVQ